MANMAGDSNALSSLSSLSWFATDLPTAAERFLARALAQTLDEKWRSADDFLRYFPPRDIMQALSGQDTLRAGILIGAAGVHAKLARKKPPESAAEDLELALAEGVTDAEQILELFPVDDRVRFLDPQKLWSFVSEAAFWQSTASDHARAIARMSFLLEAALQEELILLPQVIEAIGFSEIAEHLPPARLSVVVRRALDLGHGGRPLDEAALLEVVSLSELLEVIPLEHVFRAIIVERIAAPAGYGDAAGKASKSVIPQLSDAHEDAEVESAFDALQSRLPEERAAKSEAFAAAAPAPPALVAPPPTSVSTGDKLHVEATPPITWVRPPHEDEARERVCARLSRMDRLPPAHEALSLPILLSIESMYGELLTLIDDEAREQCIRDSFPNEQHLRTAMLALIDLLDPSIETKRSTIRDCDVESLIAVVLFEERVRQERKRPVRKVALAPVPPPTRVATPLPATRSSTVPPASGARAVRTPPPLPVSALHKR
jgi:hypothetical protein